MSTEFPDYVLDTSVITSEGKMSHCNHGLSVIDVRLVPVESIWEGHCEARGYLTTGERHAHFWRMISELHDDNAAKAWSQLQIGHMFRPEFKGQCLKLSSSIRFLQFVVDSQNYTALYHTCKVLDLDVVLPLSPQSRTM